MTRRWLINIALLVVLAALGVVVWLKPGAEPEAPKTYITMLRASDVHSIRIQQPGRKTAVFRDQDDNWRMVQPVKAPADAKLVKRWLSSIHETSSRQYPVKDLDLSAFGLKPPKLTVKLNDETIDFGGSDPIEHKRYIRRGDTIYLVNDTLFYQLKGDPLSFVSKRLLPAGSAIVGIKLPGVRLSKSRNGKWQLTPPRPKVSSDQIQRLIDHWQHAQAFNVKAADQAAVTGKVIIRLAGRSTPTTFRILKNDSLLELARPDIGVEYQLPINRWEDLLKLAAGNKQLDISVSKKE